MIEYKDGKMLSIIVPVPSTVGLSAILSLWGADMDLFWGGPAEVC